MSYGGWIPLCGHRDVTTVTDYKSCLNIPWINSRKMLHRMNPDFLDAESESSRKTCLESCIVRPRISRKGDSNGIYALIYIYIYIYIYIKLLKTNI